MLYITYVLFISIPTFRFINNYTCSFICFILFLYYICSFDVIIFSAFCNTVDDFRICPLRSLPCPTGCRHRFYKNLSAKGASLMAPLIKSSDKLMVDNRRLHSATLTDVAMHSHKWPFKMHFPSENTRLPIWKFFLRLRSIRHKAAKLRRLHANDSVRGAKALSDWWEFPLIALSLSVSGEWFVALLRLLNDPPICNRRTSTWPCFYYRRFVGAFSWSVSDLCASKTNY